MNCYRYQCFEIAKFKSFKKNIFMLKIELWYYFVFCFRSVLSEKQCL